MPSNWSRRSFLAATAGLVAGTAAVSAACSSEQSGAVAKDGSVTIKHAFGETRIPGPPQRVVSAGFTEQDDLLALGVVPIAVTDWFGGEPFGVWPWARPKLGPAQPAVLSLADGIQVDPIAALKPDLIVAVNAGLDADTYAKLSAIAPTIAQSGQDAFFEPWKAQATVVGQAVFKDADMRALITAVDDRFVNAGKENASFSGKRALVVGGTFFEDQAVVTATGWRTDFLTQMGLVIPDAIDQYVDGDRALVPRDRMASVLDAADVLIWTTESDDERNALLADPTFATLRATRNNHNVLTDKELAGAIAFGTVLSYPLVADRLPPLLATALT
ncbi:ABC transporter substrate-binding protein [Mycolicibacterium sp. YH-1]|uniref:ABC transporter substrate-binding protein n=1 Tax=Mycolicibacterium sp. YH-1 TaxID=2908837 RepID=UPI001F4C449D|nr:ABC transporter substrate-binding protein [Mycolicibacterium sp. YH-1]UNB52218.1 ABC transporter substrate-binding protein [Mycolicibacterium sp. YH-1]